MRAVLGIGNPGSRYQSNRHNAGFMLLDYLASSLNVKFKASKNEFYAAEGNLLGCGYILIKPTTYVNNSGIAALQVFENTPGLDITELLVVHDDLNLPVGTYRIRFSGGDGGHNGINSIIYHLNSRDFPRMRIGIGAEFEKGRMAEYVLSDFSSDEKEAIESVFKTCSMLIKDFISGGYKQMLDSNSKLGKKTEPEA